MKILGIAFIFIIVYLQTVIHELTHAATILIFKQKIIQIKPYPHRNNGRLIGGAVLWTQTTPLPRYKLALISLSPMIMGVFLFAIGLACCYTFGFSIWLWIPTQVALLDVICNLFCCFSKDKYNYDYTKGMTHLGFNQKQQAIIAILSLVFFIGILVREFITNMAVL